MGPVKKIPAGKKSVPPPLADKLSIKLLIIFVHLVFPDGSAPRTIILVQIFWEFNRAGKAIRRKNERVLFMKGTG
jgi:hypothetical protein